MKKKIAGICMCLLFVLGATTLHAQERLQARISYNPAMPVGSFKDFMGKNSFRGYSGEITYPLNNSFRIGLGIGYNDFYEKLPRAVYNTKGGTVSAVVSNSVQTTPILVKANYNLSKDAFIRPYVGVGAGFNLITYSHYLGEFPDNKSAFKPAAMVDAGVNIPFNRVTRAAGINIGANFNYMPFKYNGLNNLNNWGLHAGIFFPLK